MEQVIDFNPVRRCSTPVIRRNWCIRHRTLHTLVQKRLDLDTTDPLDANKYHFNVSVFLLQEDVSQTIVVSRIQDEHPEIVNKDSICGIGILLVLFPTENDPVQSKVLIVQLTRSFIIRECHADEC
ncbi:hypothetical protein M8J77_015419 [Diaphorina citri]|nr:hypothetical protein M8J77_015419 [Diaphorina citri]